MPRIPFDFYESPLDLGGDGSSCCCPGPTYGCIFVESKVRLLEQDPETAKVCAPGANLMCWHRCVPLFSLCFLSRRLSRIFAAFLLSCCTWFNSVLLGSTRFNSAQLGSTRFNLVYATQFNQEYAPTLIRQIGHKNKINFDFGLHPLKSASGLRGPKFCRLWASI